MSLVKSIGQVSKQIGVSVHTLRYYEKIGLLPPISKNTAGQRRYDQRSISRLQFIKRAQRMHFSLDEIKQLIVLDHSASKVAPTKPEVRKLVKTKLIAIDDSLSDLQQLKVELAALLSACEMSGEAERCPILDGLNESA